MPTKSRGWKKRSRAAKKGWQTRRKKNPAKWSKKALSAIRENKKLKARIEKLERSKENLERSKENLERKNRKLLAKLIPSIKHRKTILTVISARENIELFKDMGLGFDQIDQSIDYLKKRWKLTAREVYTMWMSPDTVY